MGPVHVPLLANVVQDGLERTLPPEVYAAVRAEKVRRNRQEIEDALTVIPHSVGLGRQIAQPPRRRRATWASPLRRNLAECLAFAKSNLADQAHDPMRAF